MNIFIIRHGSDMPGYRGGWSEFPLCDTGIAEAGTAAEFFSQNPKINIDCIYSSDLTRARQTAEILSEKIHAPIVYLKAFREVNNGKLSGMENETAERLYPGLYWKTLGWAEHYPAGESPAEFYIRIKTAWQAFSSDVQLKGQDVILVTHGGVMQVIYSILTGKKYTNAKKPIAIAGCDIIQIEYQTKAGNTP